MMPIKSVVYHLIKGIQAGEKPAWLTGSVRETLHRDYQYFMEKLQDGTLGFVYGTTSLVGHRDHLSISPKDVGRFQNYLIANHAIGDAPYFSDWEIKCISAAKSMQIAAGGTLVSLPLYDCVLDAAFNDLLTDHKVPHAEYCSYSCGDVIPASHWADALLRSGHYDMLGAGEGLGLINGSFIHVGLGLALWPALEKLWCLDLYVSTLHLKTLAFKPNETTTTCRDEYFNASLEEYFRKIELFEPEDSQEHQHSVSARAIPALIRTLLRQLTLFYDELFQSLSEPSGNPLFINGSIASQASFMAPGLTFQNQALLDALVFVAWNSLSRIQYLLSGKVAGIPRDATDSPDSLGFIQVPKLASALFQKAQRTVQGTGLTHATANSDGIEDVWTGGAQTASLTQRVVDIVNEMLAIEIVVTRFIHRDRFDVINCWESDLDADYDFSCGWRFSESVKHVLQLDHGHHFSDELNMLHTHCAGTGSS